MSLQIKIKCTVINCKECPYKLPAIKGVWGKIRASGLIFSMGCVFIPDRKSLYITLFLYK